MTRVFYEIRCKCKEKISFTKKRKPLTRSEDKSFIYPDLHELTSKTFHMKYDEKLSLSAMFVLKTFQNKYFYYAIDDILYSFKHNLTERNNLLTILYSPVLSLHNNFTINFFDIWIHSIHINKISKDNKFLEKDNKKFESFHYITIKLLYRTKVSIVKKEPLW